MNNGNLHLISNNSSVYVLTGTLFDNICKDIASYSIGTHYCFHLNRCMFMTIISEKVRSSISYGRRSNVT